MSYFFKDTLKLDPAQVSLYNSVINFIWLLKPLFGFISDSFPICGSHRKAYLIIFSLAGSASWILLGLWVETLGQAMFIKTLINICTSFCNVIGEGIMVEASQVNKPEQEAEYNNSLAATNVSIYLSLTSLSTILSSYLGGFLLNYYTV